MSAHLHTKPKCKNLAIRPAEENVIQIIVKNRAQIAFQEVNQKRRLHYTPQYQRFKDLVNNTRFNTQATKLPISCLYICLIKSDFSISNFLNNKMEKCNESSTMY